MSWYGQKNYTEKLGAGPDTIASAGCFLTAFCNLVKATGRGNPTPPYLNDFFIRHDEYVDGELLSWSTVSHYRHYNVKPFSGTEPPHGQGWAIVRLNPSWGTHFCFVHHLDGSKVYIVDSYDGVIKDSAIYGKIDAYALYTNPLPQSKSVYKG